MGKNVLVKVWNRNDRVYKETFKGDKIVIPAGEFIMMHPAEANDFKSAFRNPVYLKGGKPDPDHFKMIEVDPISDTIEPTPEKKN